jgi:hypothetical protein
MSSQAGKRHDPIQRARTMVESASGMESDYYSAIVRDVKAGPRREMVLRIETWPKGKSTFGSGDIVTLRFAAIVNYEEVRKYFARVPVESLHYLRELSESTARRHVVEMEFDRSGDRIRIIAGKFSKLAHESAIET